MNAATINKAIRIARNLIDAGETTDALDFIEFTLKRPVEIVASPYRRRTCKVGETCNREQFGGAFLCVAILDRCVWLVPAWD